MSAARTSIQALLTRYANERLLYRLATSSHGSRFVLKGAALFSLWTGAPHRATRDIDLLGFGDPSVENLRSVFADILALEVEEDGVRFDGDSLDVGPIREDQEYGGVRLFACPSVTMASTFAFEGELLVRAIAATFARRGTPLPSGLPVALTPEFTDDLTKNTQWGAFLRKSGAASPGDLREVAAAIARFVVEPLAAAAAAAEFPKSWAPGGPWT